MWEWLREGCLRLTDWWWGSTFETVMWAEDAGGDDMLVFAYPSGRLETFVGSGTVWYELPEFYRCLTMQEARLNEVWEWQRHKRKAQRPAAD